MPTKIYGGGHRGFRAGRFDDCKLQVIEALDGQLITNRLEFPVQVDQRGGPRAA